jgi:SAM-dependent methyltransferase
VIIFPESKNAHFWLDGLKDGIEIGGSAHNPFGLKGCRNVDYTDDITTESKLAEIKMCGRALPVDVVDDGSTLATFADNSLDYIVSSHVVEHLPDLHGALERWCEVVRDGGFIYMIVPHPWACEADKYRPLTTNEHCWSDRINKMTVETHPCDPGHGPRGHYHVFTPESFQEIIANSLVSALVPMEMLERDDKCGNGHAHVFMVSK